MSYMITSGTMLSALVLLGGCTSYRPAPLTPSVELTSLRLRTPQSVTISSVATTPTTPQSIYDSSDGLNEAEMVMVALSFNPELRNRRHEISKIGSPDLFGMVRFKPEMRVNIDQATVGLATDTDMLYTLLMPNLRQAWRNDETARRAQARAEMLAAEAQLVLAIRRGHVKLLTEEKRLALSTARSTHRQQLYQSLKDNPNILPVERSLALVAWQRSTSDFRVSLGVVDEARRDLNRLMGFDPDTQFELTASAAPLVDVLAPALDKGQLDVQLIAGRWELKVQEALYQRAEFTYSQALMGQYPKLRLGPAITYDREEGTSFRLGASLRIPWPDDAAQKAEAASVERDRARASYVAKLHELRAEAHQANARVARFFADLEALSSDLRTSDETKQLAEQHRATGVFSLSDYLPLIEQCEATEWAWLNAAFGYRLGHIDLDHATGRLNRYAQVESATEQQP